MTDGFKSLEINIYLYISIYLPTTYSESIRETLNFVRNLIRDGVLDFFDRVKLSLLFRVR